MAKIFEDSFMEVQSDMIALCMEYAEGKADKVYAYGTMEGGVRSFSVFYEANGRVVRIEGLDDALPEGGKLEHGSDERQWGVLKIGAGDLKRLRDVCGEFGQPVPTELRLVYDARTGGMTADYKYDPVYTHTRDLHWSDVFNAWFEEVKRENGE